MEGFLFEDTDDFELQNVYDHLQDNESKKLYIARSLYSLTGDKTGLNDSIRNMATAKWMIELVQKKGTGRPKVLFGLGEWGNAIYKLFPEIEFSYFVDNKKANTLWNGRTVIDFKALCEINKPYIVVAMYYDYRDIKKQLEANGFVEIDDYIILGEETEKRQYFDLQELEFSDNETFLDVGGYDGATSRRFSESVNGQYDSIYCLEPIKENYERICEYNKDLERFILMMNAATEKETELEFNIAGDESSGIGSVTNGQKVIGRPIDSVFENKRITYIKMDIEGMEISAILGGKQIITNQKPKLAISVYHRRKDIWEIPKLILRINPDYRLYFRMYSFKGNDVVLYAIPGEVRH